VRCSEHRTRGSWRANTSRSPPSRVLDRWRRCSTVVDSAPLRMLPSPALYSKSARGELAPGHWVRGRCDLRLRTPGGVCRAEGAGSPTAAASSTGAASARRNARSAAEDSAQRTRYGRPSLSRRRRGSNVASTGAPTYQRVGGNADLRELKCPWTPNRGGRRLRSPPERLAAVFIASTDRSRRWWYIHAALRARSSSTVTIDSAKMNSRSTGPSP